MVLRRLISRWVRGPVQTPVDRNRVAFVGPLPPAKTGVASYDRAVLDGLRRTGFVREVPVDPLWPLDHRAVAACHGYRLGVFQLGNNLEFHRDVYRLAWQLPGIVVLHDLALDDFVRGLVAIGDPLGRRAVREALALRDRVPASIGADEPLAIPWCASVVRRARGVIVHSEFARRYLQDLGCRTPVTVVPHPVIESEERIRGAQGRARELRAEVAARGGTTLVVAPGDLNAAKGLEAIAAAASSLDRSVHVAFVGRRIGGYDSGEVARASGLGERLRIAHDVTDEDFLAWLLAADIVVDLRFPHRGEVSGSLMRAMQVGRPSIVSATGAYLDAPEDAVLRVAAGPPDPAEVAARIGDLAGDPERRERMGAAAGEHIRRLRESEATATGYAGAIRAAFDLVRDPASVALGRWARSLSGLGFDEEAASAGHGLAYARALASLRGGPGPPDEDPLLDSSRPR